LVVVIDYGMGNLLSIKKALEFLGEEVVITDDEDVICSSNKLILPGVGAFPDAMYSIKKKRLDEIIYKELKKGKHLLGICLGMQLLFESSEEGGKNKGLGLLKGNVKYIETAEKVPHMGWNSLEIHRESQLLKGIKNGSFVYFVHSYYADTSFKEAVVATTRYGVEMPAVIEFENIHGVQFHPEKSGDVGLRILKNFKELI